MSQELSAKDKKMKEAMEKSLASPERTWFARYRQLFSLLPSDPSRLSIIKPKDGTHLAT